MESKTQTTPVNMSIKTKMSFIYNKLMKLVSCTTKTVETSCEPTTPIEEQEQKEKEELVVEKTIVAIEPQPQVVLEEPLVVEQLAVLVEPVVVEQPVSIEERI